ncbi:MAG TPA: phage tail protein [Anaerolineae bacterium]|nr:phage tail protein [Anaerolineae bacterium]HOQ99421.1 phage tail protein [Anaerolineae bacterium]HPL28966.1 phage tail protein [Anaerolineae bacterium]
MTPTPPLGQLRVTLPDGAEETVPVGRSPFNIGRAAENDLVLADPLVSGSHARLLFQGEEMVLIDLNSAGGTMVGERRLEAGDPCPIVYGQAFQVGPYTLRLEPTKAAGRAIRPERPARREAAPPPRPPEPPEGGLIAYDDAFGLPPDRSRYLRYLPPIFEDDPFLGRFLLAFEGILAPIEQTVAGFDLYLDPHTAPSFFLDQMARWLGLTLDEKWPLAKRRAVLAEAAELYRRRGTRWGLSRHIEIYCDSAPEIIEPEDRPCHFQVILRLPQGLAVDRTAIERIIEANKPAHATYELQIEQPS